MGSKVARPQKSTPPPPVSKELIETNPNMDTRIGNRTMAIEDVSSSSVSFNKPYKQYPLKLPPISGDSKSITHQRTSIDSLMELYGLNEESLFRYREAFKLCDRNNDGKISVEELGNLMRSLGEAPTNEELEKLVQGVDENGNGTVEFFEFVQMMSNRLQMATENGTHHYTLQEMFLLFDRNRDGFITANELKIAITSLGESLSDMEMNEMIKLADKDGDGKINFQEFQCMWSDIGK